MTIPLWVAEATERFWDEVGEREPFPRDLRAPIARALPMAVVSLPALRLRGIHDWLWRQGIAWGLTAHDRALRACLVARLGQGLIFLDGADPPDEQRFSLAHELAHFLRDYWLPRRDLAARLGPAALEVLDGLRPPRPEERIDALLGRVQLGYHIHLLDRTPSGAVASAAIDRAERAADLLAYELLAPAGAALAGLADTPAAGWRDALAARLVADFGLPKAQAARYAAILAPSPPSDALLRRLGLSS